MALSDSVRKKNKPAKVRSTLAETNKQWGDKQKLEAVQSWLLLGNLALTSRILNIPEITLRVWKASTWWKDAVAEIKSSDNIVLSSKLKNIVDASLAAVEDRLTNGDFQFDQKTGQVVRKPVNMKDAHKVAVDLMEKQQQLDKVTTEAPVEQTDKDRLLKLAEKFATFVTAKATIVEVDVSDVTVKEQ